MSVRPRVDEEVFLLDSKCEGWVFATCHRFRPHGPTRRLSRRESRNWV